MISLPTRKAWPAFLALMTFVLVGVGCKDFFVDPKLTSIAVTPSTTTVAVGATTPLAATGTYDDNSTKDLTGSAAWSISTSTPSGAATVSNVAPKGVVSGVFTGTATVQAAVGTISGASTVTVGPTLTSIVVTPITATIPVNGTQQYAAGGHYSDGSTAVITTSVTWTAVDSTVATIDSSGLATVVSTATSGSSTNITATSGTIVSAPVTLTVQ
jgi:trimeric autotransporter adhesin